MRTPPAHTDFLLSLLGARPHVPEGMEWDETVQLLALHGLEGLAMASHRERPFLPAAVADRLEPAYLRTSLHTTLTLEAARRGRRALEQGGIPSLLFKGAALVEDGTYSDAGARRMSDADLLIRPGDAPAAVQRLAAAGIRPWSPWSPGRVRWLDSASFTDHEAPEGLEIHVDLHWRVRYGAIRFGETGGAEPLWENADRARGLPAPEAHFLVLAEHLLKHLRVHLHLPGFGDLVRVSRRVEQWESVLERARVHPAAGSLGLLFELLRSRFDAPLPPAALEVGGGSRFRRLGREVLDPDRILAGDARARGRLRGLLHRWVLMGSPISVAGEIARTALPDARWLRARYAEVDDPLLRLRFRYWGALFRWGAGRGPSPVSPNQEFE